MKRAIADRAVAEKSDPHPFGMHQFGSIPGADRLQDAGPDNTAGAHQADFRGKQMHTPSAAV